VTEPLPAHSGSVEPRYDIFARTDEEKVRAFNLLASYGSSGRDGNLIEVAVCADCGWWGKWDGELQHPLDARPTGIVCSHPSGRHLVTRVQVRPMPVGS